MAYPGFRIERLPAGRLYPPLSPRACPGFPFPGGRRTAELGYWLAEPFAVNPASARVLEKAGFSLEGRMRASVFKDGRVLDQLLYAVVNV